VPAGETESFGNSVGAPNTGSIGVTRLVHGFYGEVISMLVSVCRGFHGPVLGWGRISSTMRTDEKVKILKVLHLYRSSAFVH
jgi:hypothetical protein